MKTKKEMFRLLIPNIIGKVNLRCKMVEEEWAHRGLGLGNSGGVIQALFMAGKEELHKELFFALEKISRLESMADDWEDIDIMCYDLIDKVNKTIETRVNENSGTTTTFEFGMGNIKIEVDQFIEVQKQRLSNRRLRIFWQIMQMVLSAAIGGIFTKYFFT